MNQLAFKIKSKVLIKVWLKKKRVLIVQRIKEQSRLKGKEKRERLVLIFQSELNDDVFWLIKILIAIYVIILIKIFK